MADGPWEEYRTAKAPAGPWEEYAAPGKLDSPRPASDAFKQPEGSAASRAGGGFWDTTVGGLKAGAKMAGDLVASGIAAATGAIRPPSQETQDALGGIVEGHKDQARKAKESWNTPGLGNKVEAFGHGLAAVTPLVGPAAAHAGERMGGSAPKFDKFGNVVEQGNAPDIAGGIGEGAGLIASSSPNNIAAPVAGKALTIAGKAIPHRITPEGLYHSSLRPSLGKKNLPKVDKQVATGLRENIPVGKKGLNKLDAAIEDLNTDIAGRIVKRSDELGPVINPLDVTKPVNRLKPTFADQVNPEADLSAINKSKGEFLRKHSEPSYTKIEPNRYADPPESAGMVPAGTVSKKVPLTVSEAQAEKQGTYRQVRKKYGELSSAEVEAQKALARGLKDEIMKRVPEIAELNARDGALIELQGELERMVAREGNKNVLGLVPATMAHNPYGFIATLLMDNPAIKSRIAIALDRVRGAARRTSGPNARALGAAAVVGNASQRHDIDPPGPVR